MYQSIDCERQPGPRRRRVDRHGHRRTTLTAGSEIGALVFLLAPQFLASPKVRSARPSASAPLDLPRPCSRRTIRTRFPSVQELLGLDSVLLPSLEELAHALHDALATTISAQRRQRSELDGFSATAAAREKLAICERNRARFRTGRPRGIVYFPTEADRAWPTPLGTADASCT
jgi:hypothetical protein